MAKASTRFRNRKINFKTRITVRVGSHALDYDDDGNDGEVEFEEDKSGSQGGAGTVDTGVDKEEEGEVHLQAALASSTASVTRQPSFATGGSSSRGGPSSPAKVAPKAFIPTPDSRGTIDDATFDALYPPNSWVDPVTYVRFSDTVEDAQIGAANYNMDDDDEDWLEQHNAQAGPPTTAQQPENGKAPLDPVPNGTTTPGRGARDRKGKGTEKNGKDERPPHNTILVGGPIGEDDFELIMETFERLTEEKAPMAHVDTELLPAFTDFEQTFSDRTIKPPLDHLKSFARSIYPHWKARRLKRGGKSIIPQLDYDESNESNPYVCFRRRELKTSRKTRRSDQQNLDRLIRLRNDLYAAHALMLKTRDRERLKLDSIETDRKIFEGRVELRELKRRLGENDGDEDILIGRKEKRRRKDEPVQGPNGMRVSLGRKPDVVFSPTSLITSVEDLRVRKERAASVATRIERDLAKKRDADQLWEDWTDGAFLTRQPSFPARYWRSLEPVPSSLAVAGSHALGFHSSHQAALGPVRTSYRRRVGRGGRIMLDRIAPQRSARHQLALLPRSSESDSDNEEEDPAVVARRQERFRYDSDAAIDFPSGEAPAIIDDFELKYTLKRAALLRTQDVEFLAPDNSYLEEAYRWVSQEPERPQPPLVYGRLPPRPPMQQVQPGGPGGVPMQVPPGTPQAQAYGQMQMMAAASHAHRMAQQQAHLKRQQQPGGPPTSDPMRKTSSSNGSPVGPVPMQLPMPMSIPMNGAPVQAQWMNGMPQQAMPQQQQLQQQQQQQHHLPPQRLPNGLVAVPSHPNGANGMPATSRLSNPPFSNQQGSSPLPPQMQRPPSSASHHQQPPSRPGSAASSHNSPSLAAQSLPGQGQPPLVSPNGLLPNGKRVSPAMHPNFPPGLQAGVPQGVLKQHQMQSMPYGFGAQT
ncbi:hypothetical protein RQP46_004007 [Phenoliferia psychrophenolica]